MITSYVWFMVLTMYIYWFRIWPTVFIYAPYSVVKDDGPDNDQDKEPSDRASEEPEAVRLIDLFF